MKLYFTVIKKLYCDKFKVFFDKSIFKKKKCPKCKTDKYIYDVF